MLALALPGCAGSARAPSRGAEGLALTVVVTGDARVATELRRRLAAPLGFAATVRLASLPGREAPVAPQQDLAADLAAARRAYVEADVTRCLELLAGDRHLALLAQGRRDEAARLLFWRVACQVAAGDRALAAADADSFATLGLSVPPDADVISPEVETLLASARPRRLHALEVEASSAGARVMLDGRWRGCVTPCSLDVAAGVHVLTVEADGFTPSTRTLRIEAPVTSQFDLVAAAPELAAAQWAASYRGGAQEGAASLALLAHAVRTRTLVMLAVDRRDETTRLRAAVASDGVVLARAEAPWGEGQPRALLRQLLLRARLLPQPPLYRRPAFWVAVGSAAAVAAGVTAAILLEPDVEVELRFRK